MKETRTAIVMTFERITPTPYPSPCDGCDSFLNRQGRGRGGFLGGKGELRSPFPPNLSTPWARCPHGRSEAAVAWGESPRESGELRSLLYLKPSPLSASALLGIPGGATLPVSTNTFAPGQVAAYAWWRGERDLRRVRGAKLPALFENASPPAAVEGREQDRPRQGDGSGVGVGRHHHLRSRRQG